MLYQNHPQGGVTVGQQRMTNAPEAVDHVSRNDHVGRMKDFRHHFHCREKGDDFGRWAYPDPERMGDAIDCRALLCLSLSTVMDGHGER